MTTSDRSAARRGNRIAAVLMLVAGGSAAIAATGTFPILFVGLGLTVTIAALLFALRGHSRER